MSVQATEVRPLWFLNGLAYVHIEADQTGGAYVLGERIARRGDMPPLHVHHRDDEAFYVVEGEVSLFVGDRHISLTEGQAALAPREVPHSYRVESDTARWLVINNPAGFEHFVRAASEPAERDELPPAGRPVDSARLAEAAAQQGIEILGPPGTLPAGTGSVEP
jgi:mannose-6-phosphate isomerase-like protein (cupin superfamily)